MQNHTAEETKTLTCPKCDRKFELKWRLRAHIRRDHLKSPGMLQVLRRPVMNLGHDVPTNARALRIVGFFPTTHTPPRGFATTDLPLFKMKYLLPDHSASVTAISSYRRICDRYAGEICDYFFSTTVLKKPGKSKLNGAFIDEKNFCFKVILYQLALAND